MFERETLHHNVCTFFSRVLFIIARLTGAVKLNTTFLEGRLDSMHKRPNYRPTGIHPSPRFVLVWRSVIIPSSLSSARRPALCTHWFLTGNTAPLHWVVTRGRRWLAHRPHCNTTVTRKVLMLQAVFKALPKQESVYLVTITTIAPTLTRELDLVQEGIMMTPTPVETRQRISQTMETNTSKPWDT